MLFIELIKHQFSQKYATVFNIDNKRKSFMSSKSAYYYYYYF